MNTLPNSDGLYRLETAKFNEKTTPVLGTHTTDSFKYSFTFEIKDSKPINMRMEFNLMSTHYIHPTIKETFCVSYDNASAFLEKIQTVVACTNSRSHVFMDKLGKCKLEKLS